MIPIAPDQPEPKEGQQPVSDFLKLLIDERTRKGISRYGTRLMSHNGRDALMDALQESLDLNQYICQLLMETRDELNSIRRAGGIS